MTPGKPHKKIPDEAGLESVEFLDKIRTSDGPLPTAKIRALANQLETGRGYKDKVGKRDLRLLVHRRQKLLQYMERKERGSERWFHLIEKLGLSDATYKGQITL